MVPKRFSAIGLALLILFSFCERRSDPLAEPLTKAHVQGKVSIQKSNEIVEVWIIISDYNIEAADSFATMIREIIENGGDSTDLDIARNEFMKERQIIFIGEGLGREVVKIDSANSKEP